MSLETDLGMTCRAVTTNTLQTPGPAGYSGSLNFGGYVLVAAAACLFRNLAIEFRDPDVVWIATGGEVKRMQEPVFRFHGVFADDVVWSMTIVAACHRVVTRLEPGIVGCLHDVAVSASLGIVRQVLVSLGIDECIGTETHGQPQQQSRDHRQRRGCTHPRDRGNSKAAVKTP